MNDNQMQQILCEQLLVGISNTALPLPQVVA